MAGTDNDEAFTQDGAAGAQLEADEAEGRALLDERDDETIAQEEGEV